MTHSPHFELDSLLKWMASCSCGQWDSPMGWASQKQAKEAWQQHVQSERPTDRCGP